MKADAWHYELVGSQMGMAVMEHLTPRMVIIHSPPLTSQPPSPALSGAKGERRHGPWRRRRRKRRQIISTRKERMRWWWTLHSVISGLI